MKSLESQVFEYLTVERESIFVKRAKYLLCVPFARYLKADMPAEPDTPFAPKGEWKRWMKSRMCLNTQNTHLWYSFFQAKRGALPLSEGMVIETYEKHRIAMSIDDPIDELTHDLVMEQLVPVLNIVRADIRQLYLDHGVTLVNETVHTASTRACFETSRALGGSIKHLMRSAGVGSCSPDSCLKKRTLPDLVRMSYHPVAYVNGHWVRDYIHEEYAYCRAEEQWREYFAGRIPLEQSGRIKCTIQAVLEPLKVRVISKGEAVPYYMCKPLQKALHTSLRRMPAFRLVGKELEEQDLIGLIRNGASGGKGPLEWFSIDYSAATDGLSARLSASILGYLIQDYPQDLQQIFKRVLAPHTCEYPKGGIESVDQRNGQLMGSILSFPILCLANLGLYLAVTADDERDIQSRMRGVLVNGDDMLYCARASRWQTHVDLGRKVGLEMSVGKAYHHSTVANANSMCFHYEIGKIGAVPKYVPFLNAGLFFGQGKVQGGDDENSSRCKTAVITELLQGMRPSRRCEALGFYLSYHKEDLKKETQIFAGRKLMTQNLFLPESVGGCGQMHPEGFRFRITSEQRQLATSLYKLNPTAWPADGVRYQEVTGECQYDTVDNLIFDQSIRAPWLAPTRSAKRRYPVLDDERMPKKMCAMGFVLTKVPRPQASYALALRCRTPEQKFREECLEATIERDFVDLEANKFAAFCDMETRGVDTLQGLALKKLWDHTKLCVHSHSIDGGLHSLNTGQLFLDQQYADEAVSLWNRRYSKLAGGALTLPDGNMSGIDAVNMVRSWYFAKDLGSTVFGDRAF